MLMVYRHCKTRNMSMWLKSAQRGCD
ncbi:hypothetical protein OK016_28975 [Vibrio chagasii]|nr:hypothetical protein [Vibrio chagasii]